VRGAEARKLSLSDVLDFNSTTGKGVKGTVAEKQVAVTDVAMEAGGITLLKGDLRGILRARRLSKSTMRNIRENLFFAFVYNAVGVPLAAGVLFPAFGLLLNPMIAAAAMSFSSVSVIANALRLRTIKLRSVSSKHTSFHEVEPGVNLSILDQTISVQPIWIRLPDH